MWVTKTYSVHSPGAAALGKVDTALDRTEDRSRHTACSHGRTDGRTDGLISKWSGCEVHTALVSHYPDLTLYRKVTQREIFFKNEKNFRI